MEFNEKLQELRRKKGLTQEELAISLYVSRTAISKWESGRGYPNIESLKQIAKFFSVTVDELLSSDELLTIAEEDSKQSKSHLRGTLCGLLDICMCLLLFLPLFADRTGEGITAVSLFAFGEAKVYLKIAYFVDVIAIALTGVSTLALQGFKMLGYAKIKETVSFSLGIASVLLFTVSSQPYAAVFAFVLLAIKVFLALKLK